MHFQLVTETHSGKRQWWTIRLQWLLEFNSKSLLISHLPDRSPFRRDTENSWITENTADWQENTFKEISQSIISKVLPVTLRTSNRPPCYRAIQSTMNTPYNYSCRVSKLHEVMWQVGGHLRIFFHVILNLFSLYIHIHSFPSLYLLPQSLLINHMSSMLI